MPDITLCTNKHCRLDCYRRFAKPTPKYQSYSTWKVKKGNCDGFWACEFIPVKDLCLEKHRTKRSNLSISKYNSIMTSIIKKGKPVTDTLIEMLDEAAKYEIKKEKSK